MATTNEKINTAEQYAPTLLLPALRQPSPKTLHDLTPHETGVPKLLVEGHNYKTAAMELSVSINTVSFHVRRTKVLKNRLV